MTTEELATSGQNYKSEDQMVVLTLRINTFFKGIDVSVPISFDSRKLAAFIQAIYLG